jgi:hypothetical protein
MICSVTLYKQKSFFDEKLEIYIWKTLHIRVSHLLTVRGVFGSTQNYVPWTFIASHFIA